jgi:hypothetical protein
MSKSCAAYRGQLDCGACIHGWGSSNQRRDVADDVAVRTGNGSWENCFDV